MVYQEPITSSADSRLIWQGAEPFSAPYMHPVALFGILNVPGGLSRLSLYVPGTLSVHVSASLHLCVCLSASGLEGF